MSIICSSQVTPAAFAHMCHLIQGICPKTVALMEGGYFMTSHAEGAALTLRSLLGDPCPNLPETITEPCQEMNEAIMNLKTCLRPYWKCFQVYHVR